MERKSYSTCLYWKFKRNQNKKSLRDFDKRIDTYVSFLEVFKNWVHGADKGAFILIPKHWQFENIMFSLYHPKYLKSVKSVYMYILLMFTFTFHCCFKIVLILVSLTEETCSLTSSLFIFVNSKILIKINIEKILKHYLIWFVWKNPIKYQK